METSSSRVSASPHFMVLPLNKCHLKHSSGLFSPLHEHSGSIQPVIHNGVGSFKAHIHVQSENAGVFPITMKQMIHSPDARLFAIQWQCTHYNFINRQYPPLGQFKHSPCELKSTLRGWRHTFSPGLLSFLGVYTTYSNHSAPFFR